MNFFELSKDRFSVRKFKDKKIEQEKLDKILEIVKYAPTAVNYQPQKIYVLQSDEAIKKIESVCNTYHAPTVILACVDTNDSWKSPMEKEYDSGEMDVSIVVTHMMLEAWELGIGSVWIRYFDPTKISKVFNLPKNIKPICLLPIGYKTDDCIPYAPWHDVTKELDEMVEIL